MPLCYKITKLANKLNEEYLVLVFLNVPLYLLKNFEEGSQLTTNVLIILIVSQRVIHDYFKLGQFCIQ